MVYNTFDNLQNVHINVLDADTLQIIPGDFIVEGVRSNYPSDHFMGTVLKAGSGTFPCRSGHSNYPMTFCKAQVEALGYDFASIKGNSVNATVQAGTKIPFFPWTVNITIKKKK